MEDAHRLAHADLNTVMQTSRRRWPARAAMQLLSVDQDFEAQQRIRRVAAESGVDVILCGDGAEGLFRIGRADPDLVLLRAGLPVLDATAVVTVVRRHAAVPVVLGIGQGQTELAGPALLAGVSEVLSYPYRDRDLYMVISQYLRDADSRRTEQAVVAVGQVELNGLTFEVKVAGEPVTLPLRQFDILRYLLVHTGVVVSLDQIREHLWLVRGDDVTTNTIKLHISRLRGRLVDALVVVNVRGVGYRAVPIDPDPV
ncbi:MAG: response regulator transcription factor [Actinomycetota bacterium]|nr:response regulator transcription factor [Nocardioidaceae bacterium]MDQ3480656.1 response regulator transcription factor [Actinomycetota bacterium]